jgi:hypothetical protein
MRISNIEAIKTVLSDGKAQKLIDIYNAAKQLGAAQSGTSYQGIYIALREHPEFFEKTGTAHYRLISKTMTDQILRTKPDEDEARELVLSCLSKKSEGKTPTQIWRELQKRNVLIPYVKVHNILQSEEFVKKPGIVANKSFGSRYFIGQ